MRNPLLTFRYGNIREAVSDVRFDAKVREQREILEDVTNSAMGSGDIDTFFRIK